MVHGSGAVTHDLWYDDCYWKCYQVWFFPVGEGSPRGLTHIRIKGLSPSKLNVIS
jgi:hypothetical protein